MPNRKQRPLHRLVADRMAELDMSSRQVGQRAAIAAGTHRHKVTDATLRGLALALDLPASALFDAAGVEPDLPEWRMPQRFRVLSPDERHAVEQIADVILKLRRKGTGSAPAARDGVQARA
jgi:hypothetical protein